MCTHVLFWSLEIQWETVKCWFSPKYFRIYDRIVFFCQHTFNNCQHFNCVDSIWFFLEMFFNLMWEFPTFIIASILFGRWKDVQFVCVCVHVESKAQQIIRKFDKWKDYANKNKYKHTNVKRSTKPNISFNTWKLQSCRNNLYHWMILWVLFNLNFIPSWRLNFIKMISTCSFKLYIRTTV